MIVMKRTECALTLMDLIFVAVKWDSDSMAMDSTAVVSLCVYFNVTVCAIFHACVSHIHNCPL